VSSIDSCLYYYLRNKWREVTEIHTNVYVKSLHVVFESTRKRKMTSFKVNELVPGLIVTMATDLRSEFSNKSNLNNYD
jgi:hypothetical protein